MSIEITLNCKVRGQQATVEKTITLPNHLIPQAGWEIVTIHNGNATSFVVARVRVTHVTATALQSTIRKTVCNLLGEPANFFPVNEEGPSPPLKETVEAYGWKLVSQEETKDDRVWG